MARSKQKSNPPKICDFSEQATKKAVLTETFQHPLTLYSTAVGFLGSMSFLLFGPTLLASAAVLGGFSLGAGSLAINYLFRRDTFANRHVEKLHQALVKHRQEVLKNIKRDFRDLQKLSGFESFADQGAEQYSRIQTKFKNLESVLAEKLSSGELTFSRYLGTAEQVYLSVLDNLLTTASTLKSVATIDTRYIQKRLDTLDSLDQQAEADKQEVDTLKKRLDLRKKQLDRVNTLLTKNEIAMTEMDNTTAAISQMKTVQGQANTDLETAMRELEELAKRADDYSL